MALPVAGLWLSFINRDSGGFPNDGALIIKPPSVATGAFDGDHFRPNQSPIRNGVYSAATSNAIDHIRFEEPEEGTNCTFVYDADVIHIGPGPTNLRTINGKRSRSCPVPLDSETATPLADPDDDWVGTHTT